ncbi:hypothetical protein V8D89_012968 [Ganoderma adspersum]
MPRLKLKWTKGNAAARKKADTSESAATPGKSGGSSSKTKKDKLVKQQEAKKELERLLALSTTGEDSYSGSEEGSYHQDSEEGSGLDEGGENASEADRRKGKRRDGSHPTDEVAEEFEVEGKAPGVGREGQICLANETEPIYQAIRILARNITEHCNPHHILIDGLIMTNLGDEARKASEKVFRRGQENTEELHLKRKSTALALFKEQSERSIQRQAQRDLRREICIEDGHNTSVNMRSGRNHRDDIMN